MYQISEINPAMLFLCIPLCISGRGFLPNGLRVCQSAWTMTFRLSAATARLAIEPSVRLSAVGFYLSLQPDGQPGRQAGSRLAGRRSVCLSVLDSHAVCIPNPLRRSTPSATDTTWDLSTTNNTPSGAHRSSSPRPSPASVVRKGRRYPTD